MYISPEVMVPPASALAAVTGMVLLFWRRVTGQDRKAKEALSRTSARRSSR